MQTVTQETSDWSVHPTCVAVLSVTPFSGRRTAESTLSESKNPLVRETWTTSRSRPTASRRSESARRCRPGLGVPPGAAGSQPFAFWPAWAGLETRPTVYGRSFGGRAALQSCPSRASRGVRWPKCELLATFGLKRRGAGDYCTRSGPGRFPVSWRKSGRQRPGQRHAPHEGAKSHG